MTTHVALIDADVLLYRSCFAIESKVVTEDVIDGEVWTSTSIEVEPVENAIQIVKDTMEMILFELNTNEYEMYLTGSDNFRKELATVKEYKGNRKNARKPIHLEALREHCVEHFGATVVNGQEADDALGIRLTELGEQGVVASVDKDLWMVPGKHYDWTKGIKKITSDEWGWRYFYTQLLTGDATDNIPGCPGIGPKKAAKALADVAECRQMWTTTYDLYHQQMEKQAHRIVEDMVYKDGDVCYTHWKSGEDRVIPLREYIEEIANLLWIRRYPDQRWEIPA